MREANQADRRTQLAKTLDLVLSIIDDDMFDDDFDGITSQ
jgi:hypothetical protein